MSWAVVDKTRLKQSPSAAYLQPSKRNWAAIDALIVNKQSSSYEFFFLQMAIGFNHPIGLRPKGLLETTILPAEYQSVQYLSFSMRSLPVTEFNLVGQRKAIQDASVLSRTLRHPAQQSGSSAGGGIRKEIRAGPRWDDSGVGKRFCCKLTSGNIQ
jgi:hypothetical protein